MVDRFMAFLPIVELEQQEAAARGVPLMVEIAERRVRIHR
jgi:hypothetical protein